MRDLFGPTINTFRFEIGIESIDILPHGRYWSEYQAYCES